MNTTKIVDKSSFVKEKSDIDFCSNGHLTLGVEIELQIIDSNSLSLVNRASEIIDLAQKNGSTSFKQEMYQSAIEVVTDKCQNVHEIEQDFLNSLNLIDKFTPKDIKYATNGTHPKFFYNNYQLTDLQRYHDMIQVNQIMSRRVSNFFGLHVHLGLRSGNDAIRFNNFFLELVPHLIALSASSPFWCGEDSGLNSVRLSNYEAHPCSGHPFLVNNWQEFEDLYFALKKSKSITTTKDLWWDIRPSPNYGTIEIRVCDGLSNLKEAVAITAFIHLLAYWFEDNSEPNQEFLAPKSWRMRQNKCNALRYGIEADILLDDLGNSISLKKDLINWLDKLSKYEEKLGYQRYVSTIRNIIQNGNSSQRQREVFLKNNSIDEVILHNISEFENKQPIWQTSEQRFSKIS